MISSLGLRAAAWEDDLRPVRLRISGDHPGDGTAKLAKLVARLIMLGSCWTHDQVFKPLGNHLAHIRPTYSKCLKHMIYIVLHCMLRNCCAPSMFFCPSKSSASSVNILQLAIHSHHHILPQKPPIPTSGSGSKLAIPQEPGHMENLVNPTINLQKFGHGLCQCMVILRMVYVLPHSSTLFTILHPSKCQDSVGMKTRSDLL